MKVKRFFVLLTATLTLGVSAGCGGSFDKSKTIVTEENVMNNCSEARVIMTLANQALAEMEEERITVTLEGWYDYNTENVSDDAQFKDLVTRMCTFSDKAEEKKYSLYISEEECKGAVVKDGIFGCYPGSLSYRNYYDLLGENPSYGSAKDAAEREIKYY